MSDEFPPLDEYLVNLMSDIIGKPPTRDMPGQHVLGTVKLWELENEGNHRLDFITNVSFPKNDSWEPYAYFHFRITDNEFGEQYSDYILAVSVELIDYEEFDYLVDNFPHIPKKMFNIWVNEHPVANTLTNRDEIAGFIDTIKPQIKRWYDIKLEAWRREHKY